MSIDDKVGNIKVERLVRQSQAGSRGAFDELVRIYQQKAMELAVRMLGDAATAADVVQQGFVNAYLNIGKLREPCRFEIWLLRIIANTTISHTRAAGWRFERLKTAENRQDNKAFSPEQNQIETELKEAIQAAMLKLSKKQMQAISLFGLNGLSQKQAAQIMGCSVEVVKWHVFKARKKLKVLLKEYIDE